MKIVKMWCETTKEGKEYLKFNGYKGIKRIGKKLWLVTEIGNELNDVKIIF